MGSTILVTGAAGYLGSILVPELLERDHKVIALDTFDRCDTTLAHVAADTNFVPVRGDARDEETLKELVAKADIAIPLAALVGAPLCKQDPLAARTTNFDAIVSLLVRLGGNRVVPQCWPALLLYRLAGLQPQRDPPRKRPSLHHRGTGGVRQ